MRVYEATVIDKCASPSGEEPVGYESHIAVGTYKEISQNPKDYKLPEGWSDEQVHFYFTEDEFKPVDGEIETEEFKYLVGERVA